MNNNALRYKSFISIVTTLILATIFFSGAMLSLSYATTINKAKPQTQNHLAFFKDRPLILTNTVSISKAPPHKAPPLALNNPIIMTETFESAWPPQDGLWTVTGDPHWDDTSFKAFRGRWSIWPAKGGSLGVDPANNPYPPSIKTRAIYGPFSLLGVVTPYLRLDLWNKSEDIYDTVWWGASIDGENFYGPAHAGDTGGWTDQMLNLRNVPVIGDLSGRYPVWINVYFQSNATTEMEGPFIDNIAVYEIQPAKGMIFNPSPMVSANDKTLTDTNDANDPLLNKERVQHRFTNLDGSGYLRGDYVDLVTGQGDFSNCDTGIERGTAMELSQVFSYTRADERFEEANIYYHITKFNHYLEKLGYGDIINRPVIVHAHCYTEDKSNTSSDFVIKFGDGGVDDAEDAEVIIHEFTHLVVFNTVGFTTTEYFQHDTMSEGWSDYFASSFFEQQTISPTFKVCFAEWSASGYTNYLPHNNPRCMRRLDTRKHYPEDIIDNIHRDSEIFSGALWDLRSIMGQTTTDKLVLESLDELGLKDGFSEAGDALIVADQTLNQGVNRSTIALIFKLKGFFDNFEWNNDADHATEFLVDVLTQTHSFYSKTDVDWFKFEATPTISTWYKIQTANLQTGTDTIITLYDTNKTTILSDNDNCGNRQSSSCLTWQPPTTGTYYLKVNQIDAEVKNTGITFTYDINVSTAILIFTNTIYLPIIAMY